MNYNSLTPIETYIDSVGNGMLKGICWTQAEVPRTDIEFITNIRAMKSRKM